MYYDHEMLERHYQADEVRAYKDTAKKEEAKIQAKKKYKGRHSIKNLVKKLKRSGFPLSKEQLKEVKQVCRTFNPR